MSMQVNEGGQAPSTAVSRVRPWLTLSAVAGAATLCLSLHALWRPFPLLPAPSAPLSVHASYAFKSAAHAALPFLWEGQSAEYARHWTGLIERGEAAPIAWRACLAALLALLPGALLAKGMLASRDGLLHLRGARRHEGTVARELLGQRLAKRVKRRPDHEIAPGIRYPSDLWSRHTLIVGGVGAGKSTALLPLVAKIVGSGDRLLCNDAKGEFTQAFGAPALIAPWDARSLAWDIARDLGSIGDIRRFARALVPDGTDPFWASAAREILVGYLIHLRSTRGTAWGWSELAEMLMTPANDLKNLMAAHNKVAVRSVERMGATTNGILMTLSAYCSSIFDLGQAWGAHPAHRRVSFKEWALNEPIHRQIFIQGHGSYPQLSAALSEGILGVIAGLMGSPELPDDRDRKLWIIADEFAQMGKAPLRKICEVGRSKGARVVIATQDFAQLEEIHGKPSVQALVSMCGTLMVGQIGPGETAEAMCKALGSREVERRNVSQSSQASAGQAGSMTASWQREELALYKASELGSRLGPSEDGASVVFALSTGGEVYELAWPIRSWPKTREPYVGGPWVSGVVVSAAERATLEEDLGGAFDGLELLDEEPSPDPSARRRSGGPRL